MKKWFSLLLFILDLINSIFNLHFNSVIIPKIPKIINWESNLVGVKLSAKKIKIKMLGSWMNFNIISF